MLGLYFLLCLIAFVLVVYWVRANDKIPPSRHTVGLLRTSKVAVREQDGAGPGPTGGRAPFRMRGMRD